MGSSPGFASTTPDLTPCSDSAFSAAPPPEGVNLAGHGNSPDHYAKARGQGLAAAKRPPTACRRGVSGSVSSPDRGSSHRSVAPTGFAIGRHRVLSLAGWSPANSGRVSSCPTLLGCRIGEVRRFAYGTVTRSGAIFQTASAPLRLAFHGSGPTTPSGDPLGLGWSPFARRY